MKSKKKLLASFALCAACALTGAAFMTGCGGDTDDKDTDKGKVTIVAQATADDAHGIPVHFLYQEYSDGKVSYYRIQGGGSYKATPLGYEYTATVTKTKDNDGDTEVKLTVTGNIFKALGQDFSAYGDPAYTEGYTNTYATAETRTTYLQSNDAPYVYDIAIPWEISGEHKNTTVNVKPISSVNEVIDATQWMNDYKAQILEENAGGGNQGGTETPTDKAVAAFIGVADDGITGANIELMGDYTAKASIGYYSQGKVAYTYFTQTGVWNCVNGQFVILMNAQQDSGDNTTVSNLFTATAAEGSTEYSFTYQVTRDAAHVDDSDEDEHISMQVSFDLGETTAPETKTPDVVFFNSVKANDYGDNGIQVMLCDGGLTVAYSGFYAGGMFRSVYMVAAGTWSVESGVYTVKIGEATYTSSTVEGTVTLAGVVMDDVTLDVKLTSAT